MQMVSSILDLQSVWFQPSDCQLPREDTNTPIFTSQMTPCSLPLLREIAQLRPILNLYQMFSGQLINNLKSHVIFANKNRVRKLEIIQISQSQEENLPMAYLGFPLHWKPSKEMWALTVARFDRKLGTCCVWGQCLSIRVR
ncbi:hypothetical protein KI387_012187, partial [Taxus chinensis]